MKSGHQASSNKTRLTCAGTGLVALDLIITGKEDSALNFDMRAGGSCGNVLTILSFLGWDSFPLVTLGEDVAADVVIEDLANWRVNCQYVNQSSRKSTPIVVERIGVSRNGIPRHRYYWKCPGCGARLPRFTPIGVSEARQALCNAPSCGVFYFDRVSKAAIEMARHFRNSGTLIFFEPTSIKNEALFMQCLETADVVKYSHERLGHARELTKRVRIPLEIETLGAAGLSYRYCGRSRRKKDAWKKLDAFVVSSLRDAAGAGDWCSAGLIHILGAEGREVLAKPREEIDNALNYGQALAALNCYFNGPRGAMYEMSKESMMGFVNDIWGGRIVEDSNLSRLDHTSKNRIKAICPNCASD